MIVRHVVLRRLTKLELLLVLHKDARRVHASDWNILWCSIFCIGAGYVTRWCIA